MRRLLPFVILAFVAAGGWYFFQNYQLEGLDQIAFRRKGVESADPVQPVARPDRTGGNIRLASFNIQVFGERKLRKPKVMAVLTDVIRRFDVVAIQEIRSVNQHVLPSLIELLNADGDPYDYVIGERQGRTSSKEQYAFVFDTETIEVDRAAAYSIDDPDDLLHRPPLVCPFRVRGPPSNETFTFTLINVHTDPDEVDQELDVLADVYREVRRHSGGEDDIILLGDLNTDDRHLGRLGEVAGIRVVIAGAPTNTRQTKQYDNLALHGRSTTEFTGRAGVFDLMREYNLTLKQTLEVSDHLPVWAEFSAYEHGLRGHVAAGGSAEQTERR